MNLTHKQSFVDVEETKGRFFLTPEEKEREAAVATS